MNKIDIGLSVHNKFEVQRIRNGGVDKTAYAYNIVTNEFNRTLVGANNTTKCFAYLGIGTGEGTPSVEDSELFNHLATVATEEVSREAAYPTSTLVVQATFPADTSKVGILTEVGLRNAAEGMPGSGYITHAMLQDSEGNPITIEKTDTDIIVITATVYITFTHNLDYVVPAENNVIIEGLLNRSFRGLQDLIGYVGLDPEIATRLYCSINDDITDTTAIWYTYGNSVARMDWATSSSSTRTLVSKVTRAPADCLANGLTAKYLTCAIGYKKITQEDFPAYTLQPMLVGVGDGVTTDFTCPIPVFIENTEEIKVNDAVMQRGIDYTVDYDGNSCLCPSEGLQAGALTYVQSPHYWPGNGGCAPIMLGAKDMQPNSANVKGIFLCYAEDYVLFDLLKAKTCDTLVLHKLYRQQGECGLYFEYSNDNVDWTPVVTIPKQSYQTPTIPAGGPVFKFEPVSARYWRYRMFAVTSAGQTNLLQAYGAKCFFGHVGEGIKFSTPPADGAEITIKATVQHPFKTSDYVIDCSCSITF